MIKDSIERFRFMRQQGRKGQEARSKTKQRLGLAQRDSEIVQSKMRQGAAALERGLEETYSPSSKVNSWADEIDTLRAERQEAALDAERSTTGALTMEPRTQTRYPNSFSNEVEVPENIQSDPEFTSAVEELANKYNISPTEVYAVVQGESGFNPQAQNASGATGLFQFMPATAEELGTSVDAIKSMSPTEQVELYDRYLERWNYDGSNRLGIMQAAPAYADRSPDDIIYDVGSAAWDQNPGWRELGDGPITVRSINAYYSRRAT